MPEPERTALFIDGANLYATAKTLGFDVDYKRLLREFQGKGRLIRAFYYTALVEDQEYSSIRPLIDWLDYNGYAVVTKPTKEFVDSMGRRKVKGNMDIELAVDAMEMAEHIDHMVLFSGDGDFRSLVEAVQRRGVRVSVVSTVTTQPPMVADELRRQADEFIDLVHLVAKIGRDSDRPERAPRLADRRPAMAHSYGPGQDEDGPSGQWTAPRGLGEPPVDCPLCPRLVEFRQSNRRSLPLGHNAPVPSFGPADARLLVVGLAPGLNGANRTGRPFTGDWAGDLLYETLGLFGLATGQYDERPDDGLALVDCAITNAVRCVPPANKPTPQEIATCRTFLVELMEARPRLAAIVVLGRIAHDSFLRTCGARLAAVPFRHGATHDIAFGVRALRVFDSYHCSRYNTNTGVLTPEMFRAVFADVRAFLAGAAAPILTGPAREGSS